MSSYHGFRNYHHGIRPDLVSFVDDLVGENDNHRRSNDDDDDVDMVSIDSDNSHSSHSSQIPDDSHSSASPVAGSSASPVADSSASDLSNTMGSKDIPVFNYHPDAPWRVVNPGDSALPPSNWDEDQPMSTESLMCDESRMDLMFASPPLPMFTAMDINISTTAGNHQLPQAPLPSGPMQADNDMHMTPAQLFSVPHAVTDSIPAKLPPRPVRLQDLPTEIKTRILSRHRERVHGNVPELLDETPSNLLPISRTCTEFRNIVGKMCSRLSFRPYMSWYYITGWLKMASPGIEAVSFYELHDDDESSMGQVTPPAYTFDTIAQYAPTVTELDLSGIQLLTKIDSRSLGRLLGKVRATLTKLVVKDFKVHTQRLLAKAVAQGKLHSLVEFKVLTLHANRGKDLQEMLDSFRNISSGQTALRRVAIEVLVPLHLEYEDNSFNGSLESNEFSQYSFPEVEEVDYSIFYCDPYAEEHMPTRFLMGFPDLKVLTLTRVRIHSNEELKKIRQCTKLEDLRIRYCRIEETSEDWERTSGLEQPSEGFIAFTKACGSQLTALWLPKRSFNARELEELVRYHPGLTELGITLAPNAGQALRHICDGSTNNLIRVGIFGAWGEGMQTVTSEDQANIVAGLGVLPLQRFESWNIALSTANLEAIVRQARATLTAINIHTNFTDCRKAQVSCVFTLLRAATNSRNLTSIDVDSRRVQPLNGARLTQCALQCLTHLKQTAPRVQVLDLIRLAKRWIAPPRRTANRIVNENNPEFNDQDANEVV